MDELYNICFCALLDGGTDHTPMTLETAAYNLECMQADMDGFPEGITSEQFMTVWNETLACLNGNKTA